MALNSLGELVTFSLGGVTTAGIVISQPSTTVDRVAYFFRPIGKDKFTWAHESDTTATTGISGSV